MAVPALISGIDEFSDADPETVHARFEACKTSIDSSMAQLAAEQAKLDDTFAATLNLTKGLQEQVRRSTAKVVRDAS